MRESNSGETTMKDDRVRWTKTQTLVFIAVTCGAFWGLVFLALHFHKG